MGGIEPARSLILAALAGGASVVTANKALLAAHGPELFEAADAAGTDLYFEAAVAGAIPIVRPVRESLAGDHVERILGIVNGTTNYVLDEMTQRGLDYDVAVKQAQELGYAEADPTADVEGFDAAAKAAILASLAFHQRVCLGRRLPRGHHVPSRRPTSLPLASPARSSSCSLSRNGPTAAVAVRVHPALVPLGAPACRSPRRVQRDLC